MTIGERLEEARKRKGVSIREAAEATKIRGDFLLAMENNSFDINLPEIYTRGFLKIYANFLKLDVDKIVTDYEATRLGVRKNPRGQTLAPQNASMAPQRREPSAAANPPPQGGGRASFGRMELGDSPSAPQPAAGEAPELGRPAGAGPDDGMSDRALYYKLGIGIASLVGLIIIVALVVTWLSGDKPPINPELNRQPVATQPPATTDNRPIELMASDSVTLLVTQKNDGQRIFEGTLNAGETRALEATGPVEIQYSRGDALTVVRGTKRLRMATTGPGRSTIN